ncbi:MAG TPA: thiol:disulfide interchange protein, partial [Gammaproteobacteria bacterium]|nr:thiol:disulfide interchange protein [Gammaproteobacteria bacterium]
MKKLYTNRLNLRLALVLFLICFFPLSTLSNSNFNTGQSSVTLLTESNQIGSEETLLVGLEFKLSPGWHTYWENPGDSGEGASIKWNLPSRFKASTILWPGPERIPVEPLMTYG